MGPLSSPSERALGNQGPSRPFSLAQMEALKEMVLGPPSSLPLMEEFHEMAAWAGLCAAGPSAAVSRGSSSHGIVPTTCGAAPSVRWRPSS